MNAWEAPSEIGKWKEEHVRPTSHCQLCLTSCNRLHLLHFVYSCCFHTRHLPSWATLDSRTRYLL